MKTYQVAPEERAGLGNWAIRILVDGVMQQGAISTQNFETAADAQKWADTLATLERQ